MEAILTCGFKHVLTELSHFYVTVTHSLSLLKCEYHKKCDFQTDVGQSYTCIISTGDGYGFCMEITQPGLPGSGVHK